MKKLFFICLLVGLGYYFFSANSPTFNQVISLEQTTIAEGPLLLINRETPLQQDPTNLAPIPTDFAPNVYVGGHYLLDAQALTSLYLLFAAADMDEVSHFTINSAYRSGKTQQQLYEQYGETLALPSGFSEHQSGLSLDIGSTQGTMDNTLEGDWLAEHAQEYGFILRYPKHKTEMTGISFEPWHFRYVGLPHSMMMEQNDYVLEEYLQFLQQEQNYEMKIDGITYVVQYVQAASTASIPDTTNYRISGNNLDGYIITSILE